MGIHFYHPNKVSTGFAASFWFSDRDDTIFATILKQAGWDEKTQNGIFKDSMNDPLKRVNIKLGYVEIAAILDCIERSRPFATFHDNEESPKQISFSPWLDKQTKAPKGFSFSITVANKQDSTFKNSFYIGLTFAEARLVREFMVFCLHTHFQRLKSPQRPSPPEAPKVVDQEPSPEVPNNEDVPDPLIDF
jgi:hypothetical protein